MLWFEVLLKSILVVLPIIESLKKIVQRKNGIRIADLRETQRMWEVRGGMNSALLRKSVCRRDHPIGTLPCTLLKTAWL